MKRILFLTSTRADYGKLKSLMHRVEESSDFELQIFITGMHMLSKYGETYKEVEKDGFKNMYKFINQKSTNTEQMDITLSNTVLGLSNYINEIKPDVIVIHGDRLEALAGAIVGAFNNIKIIHIEGGEVSGTIDESIRHAITKFAHYHLVANEEAQKRIMQLGENEENIFIFGSPDIDIMYSENLPNINLVKDRYEIEFDNYSILIYHPVTTESDMIKFRIKEVVDAVIESNRNYIVIYPNNDLGNEFILDEYKRFEGNNKIKIYPSMRFEYFLTLLKNSDFIIGNSSSGIREACVYGVPAIDVGNRQEGRYGEMNNIVHIEENSNAILNVMDAIEERKCDPISYYGNGKSDQLFIEILRNDKIWGKDFQKRFIDLKF